jgi:FlaA1/EpsC-like NDP-sugar epimerase
MLQYWVRCRIIHISLDFILVLACFLLAYFIRVDWVFSTDFDFGVFAIMSAIGAAMWVLFLAFARYYRIPPRSGAKEWYDFALILIGGVIANGMLIVVYFFPQEILFSRLISVYAFLFASLALITTQILFKVFMVRLKKQNKQVYRLLIVGANNVSENFIAQVHSNPYALYEVVGVIDPYGIRKTISGSTILGKLDKLESICADKGVTSILQCDAFEQTLNLISFCEEHHIKFQFDPALRGVFEKNLRIREVAGHTTISFVKRDFDDKGKRKRYAFVDAVLNQVFDID